MAKKPTKQAAAPDGPRVVVTLARTEWEFLRAHVARASTAAREAADLKAAEWAGAFHDYLAGRLASREPGEAVAISLLQTTHEWLGGQLVEAGATGDLYRFTCGSRPEATPAETDKRISEAAAQLRRRIERGEIEID